MILCQGAFSLENAVCWCPALEDTWQPQSLAVARAVTHASNWAFLSHFPAISLLKIIEAVRPLYTELTYHIFCYLVIRSELRPISLSQPLIFLPNQLLPVPGSQVVTSTSPATVMADLNKLRSSLLSIAFKGWEVSKPGKIVLAVGDSTSVHPYLR